MSNTRCMAAGRARTKRHRVRTALARIVHHGAVATPALAEEDCEEARSRMPQAGVYPSTSTTSEEVFRSVSRRCGRSRRGELCGFVLVLLFGLVAPAAAQVESRAGNDSTANRGRVLVIGASLGGGLFRCSQDACGLATWAAGFDVQFGRMLLPRLGLVVDGWVMIHPEDGARVANTFVTLGPRLWASSKLWLWGGLGLGHSCVDSTAMPDSSCELAFGFAGGVGYEIATADFFALDLQFRAGDVLASEMSGPTATVVSAGLGFTWF